MSGSISLSQGGSGGGGGGGGADSPEVREVASVLSDTSAKTLLSQTTLELETVREYCTVIGLLTIAKLVGPRSASVHPGISPKTGRQRHTYCMYCHLSRRL